MEEVIVDRNEEEAQVGNRPARRSRTFSAGAAGLVIGGIIGIAATLWLGSVGPFSGWSQEGYIGQLPAPGPSPDPGKTPSPPPPQIVPADGKSFVAPSKPSEGEQRFSGEAMAQFLDTAMAMAQRRADGIVHAATLFVTACAFLSGLFQVVVIWLGMTRVQELKEKVKETAVEELRKRKKFEKKSDDLKIELKGVADEVRTIKKQELEPLRADIKRQEEFQRRLTTEFMGPTLVWTLNSLVDANVLSDRQRTQLKREISVREALLYLTSPDIQERRKVLYRLRGAGNGACVGPLKELISNPEEDPELRVLAQKILPVIEARSGPDPEDKGED